MSRVGIPFWQPEFGGLELRLLREVLSSGFVNDGAYTRRFEEEIASFLGTRHAVAVTSGTAALFCALAGLGVGPGDEVLVPDITFIATANAVTLTGARPVLVDVLPETLTMDPSAAARAVTHRTKALVPVHVSGRAAPMKTLLRLARDKGLRVVEDAAEALGSRHAGRFLGTLGDAGCFSLTANKLITSGQGGVVVTDDSALHRRLLEIKDQGRPVRGTGGADTHESVGYNFKFTNLQAAVILGQMRFLRRRNARLSAICRAYHRHLRGVPGLRLLPWDLDRGEAPLWVDALAERRDHLHDRLEEAGAHCRKFWHPLHTQRPYQRPDAEFPVSTRMGAQALWLPSSFQMTGGSVAHVCRLVKEALG